MRYGGAILAGLLGLATVAFAAPKSLELSDTEVLAVDVPEGLVASGAPASGDRLAAMTFKDKTGLCEMRLRFAKLERTPDKAELQQELVSAGERLLGNVVETRVVAQEMVGGTFTTVYFELTDKRAEVPEGRYLLQGLGVSEGYLCQFLLLAKEKDAPARKLMFAALRSMQVAAKK